MKYANYDAENKITGYYDSAIHKTIPTPNIELSDQEWSDALAGGHNRIVDGKTAFVAHVPTAEEIAEATRILEIVTAQNDSGLKSVSIAQAEAFIDSHMDNVVDLPTAKEEITIIFKKMIPYLLK